ncbi:unnamed protein product, partial [Polarella glacialis]
ALLAALEMVKKLSATYGVSAVDAERLTTQIKGAVHAAASNSAAEVPTPTKCAAISSSAEGTDAEAAQKALARTKAPVQLLASTRRIREFSTARQPSPEDRVVYASGSFDMFHVGHAQFLKEAREQGTFLLVGIHDDMAVSRAKGPSFPVMNLN